MHAIMTKFRYNGTPCPESITGQKLSIFLRRKRTFAQFFMLFILTVQKTSARGRKTITFCDGMRAPHFRESDLDFRYYSGLKKISPHVVTLPDRFRINESPRPLFLQACTEMVMPMCADGIHDMFEPTPWNVTEYSAGCMKRWGVKPDLDWIITHYGDRHIKAASNIVFRLVESSKAAFS